MDKSRKILANLSIPPYTLLQFILLCRRLVNQGVVMIPDVVGHVDIPKLCRYNRREAWAVGEGFRLYAPADGKAYRLDGIPTTPNTRGIVVEDRKLKVVKFE